MIARGSVTRWGSALGIVEDHKGFLFRTARGHDGSALSDKAMGQPDARRMIRDAPQPQASPRRSAVTLSGRQGLPPISQTAACREHAKKMAADESPRTTKLYDRTKERLTQDEVETIRL
jgi:hypothetical protein